MHIKYLFTLLLFAQVSAYGPETLMRGKDVMEAQDGAFLALMNGLIVDDVITCWDYMMIQTWSFVDMIQYMIDLDAFYSTV